MNIYGSYTDPKILKFAIENDLIMFGLESSKYASFDLKCFAKGIEEIIIEEQKGRQNSSDKLLDEYTKKV